MATSSFRQCSESDCDSNDLIGSADFPLMARSTGAYYAPKREEVEPSASTEMVPGARSASPVQITAEHRSPSPAPIANQSQDASRQSGTSTQSSSSSASRKPAASRTSSGTSDASKRAVRARSLNEARVAPKVRDPKRTFTAPASWSHQVDWAKKKGLPWNPFEQPKAKELAPQWPALLKLRKGTHPASYQDLLMIEIQFAADNLDRNLVEHVIKTGEASPDDLYRIAKIALYGLEGREVFLNPALGLLSTLCSVPLDRCVTVNSSDVAKQVFEIAELCEMVLGFCRAIEIARFETTHLGCHFVQNIKVAKWQEYMGLEPRTKPDGLPHVPIEEIFHHVGFNVHWKLAVFKYGTGEF